MTERTDAAPGSYRLLMPPGWEQFPLGGNPIAKVRTVVARQTANVPAPHAAALRQDLERTLLAQLREARDRGGIDAFVLVDAVEGKPVDAACVVSVVPGPPGDADIGIEDVAVVLGRDAARLEFVEIGGREAIKTVEATAPDAAERMTTGREGRTFRYYVQIPGSRDLLLLTFATSTYQIFEELELLFDAMAGNLTWH